MSKVDTRVEMDAALLERLDDEAQRIGRTRDEFIEDSVRRTLAGQILAGIFSRVRPLADLTDEQAEAIAYRELNAARSEDGGDQLRTKSENASQ